MSATIVKTSDSDLAAFWLSCGLEFLEADAVTDPRRVALAFRDPDNRERDFTRQFFRNAHAPSSPRAVLQAHKLMRRAVYRAKTSDSRRCTGEELRARMWDEQHATFERISAERQATVRSVAGNRGRS